jgi:7,8-dihydropterin-6-yl-methyl-4-(beta-D-ribofuranosyl)aminobenzene 5'-phosphate synthase
VLSHNHTDHTGGLEAIVAANPHLAVYAPRAFAAGIKARVADRARVVEVGGPLRIAGRARVTGDLGGPTVEQALVLELGTELAVVTGCAHPGIVDIVRRVGATEPVSVIVGGFHLKDKDEREISKTVAALQQLGAQRAAPSHCTGDRALRAFKAAFGAGFIPSGAGAIIQLQLSNPPAGMR